MIFEKKIYGSGLLTRSEPFVFVTNTIVEIYFRTCLNPICTIILAKTSICVSSFFCTQREMICTFFCFKAFEDARVYIYSKFYNTAISKMKMLKYRDGRSQ